MEEQQLTKRQRRLLRKEEREQVRGKETKKKKIKKTITLIIAIGIVVLIAASFTEESHENTSSDTNNYSLGDPTVGREDAVVVIEEYSDFQCPACKAAEPVVKQVLSDFEGSVRFVYNDFPLIQIHPNAFDAAAAAGCANDQSKFWEYHDILFDRQSEWSGERNPEDLFFRYASELELDEIVFSSCVEEGIHENTVRSDITEGNGRRVNSTPTFFVNGEQTSVQDLYSTVAMLVASATSDNTSDVIEIETPNHIMEGESSENEEDSVIEEESSE